MSFDFRKIQTKLFGQFHLQLLISLNPTFILKIQKCSINYISGMKKQKSEVLPVCKCNQYEQQITKIRRKIIETLAITTKVDSYSAYRLLKMLIYAFTERQKYIQFIDNQLRNEMRKNPTIEYRQGMNIQQMINTLFNRVSKEKIIHHYAVQKERQIMNKYVKETRSAAEQIDYLKQLLIQQQREQQIWKNEALKQEKVNISLKKQIQLKNEEKRLLQELVKKLELKINSLQVKIIGLEKDKSQLSRDYLLKSEQVAKLASNLQSFKGQLSYNSKVELNQQIQAIMSERSIDCNPETTGMSSLHKHNSSIVNEYHLYSHLFVGEVLLNQEQSKRFLIQTLQNHSKNAISRTKFIYKMDYYNTTNIHKYIDGIPHLVFLIRTDHGQLIAAYSQGSFKPKTISNRDGLLINLTHQKVFANTKKAIVYDQVQVIFGNFDLKFKIGQSKLFSNFGTTNSFYECKGETINSLLGQGKIRQAKLKTYEIFQLFYQL